jgi:hypothetical protein
MLFISFNNISTINAAQFKTLTSSKNERQKQKYVSEEGDWEFTVVASLS